MFKDIIINKRKKGNSLMRENYNKIILEVLGIKMSFLTFLTN